VGGGKAGVGCRKMDKLKLTSGSMIYQKQSFFLKDTVQKQSQNSQIQKYNSKHIFKAAQLYFISALP